MPSFPVYDMSGKKTSSYDLPEGVFAVPMNLDVMHRVVTIAKANTRISTAHTKGRSDVRGGGRKPWKQKGTGRARAGTIRSPLWRGGGITFGPRKTRVFGGKVNRKERQAALKMALSDLVREKKLILLSSVDLSEPKTKILTAAVEKFPIEKKTDSVLFVTRGKNDDLVRASNNVSRFSISHVDALSPSSVLEHGVCVMTVDAVDALVNRFSAKGKNVESPTKKSATKRTASPAKKSAKVTA